MKPAPVRIMPITLPKVPRPLSPPLLDFGRGSGAGGSTVNLLNGLRAYYRFDDNGLDSSGNSQTLTTSSPIYIQGIIGRALGSGTASRATIAGVGANGPVSISCWAKPIAPFDGAGSRCGWNEFQFTISSDPVTGQAVVFSSHSDSYTTANGAMGGSWTHIALTWNGVTWKAYFNGAQVATGVNGPVNITAAPFAVDGSSADQQTPYDEVAVYDRALTAAEVAALAGAIDPTVGSGVFNGLIHYLPLTEASGTRGDLVGSWAAAEWGASTARAVGGPLGFAADFSDALAVNRGFRIPSSADMEPTANGISFVQWVNFGSRADTDGLGRSLLWRWPGGGNNAFVIVNEAFSGFRLFRSLTSSNGSSFSGNDMDANLFVQPGEWQMVVRSLAGTGTAGSRFDTYSPTITPPALTGDATLTIYGGSTAPLDIGFAEINGSAYRFRGLMGPIMVWNRRIDRNEGAYLYNNGTGRFPV